MGKKLYGLEKKMYLCRKLKKEEENGYSNQSNSDTLWQVGTEF